DQEVGLGGARGAERGVRQVEAEAEIDVVLAKHVRIQRKQIVSKREDIVPERGAAVGRRLVVDVQIVADLHPEVGQKVITISQRETDLGGVAPESEGPVASSDDLVSENGVLWTISARASGREAQMA